MGRDAQLGVDADPISALELEPSDWTSALPCSPAPHTSVCASSSVPDLSLTRVGLIDSTTSPVFTSTPRFSSASTVYFRMSSLNIGKISGPASTSVILAVPSGTSG